MENGKIRAGLVVNQENRKFPWIFDAFIARGHRCQRVPSEYLARADAEFDLILFAQYGHGIGLGLPMRVGQIDAGEKWPTAGAQPKAGIGPQGHRAVWAVYHFDTFLLHPEKPLCRQPGLVTDTGVPTSYWHWLRRMDFVLCKDRGLFPELRKMGIRAEYLDQGCPSNLSAMTHSDKPEFDVVFFGNLEPAWHQRRLDIAALCEAGFKVAVAGRSGDAIPRCATALPYCDPMNLPALASRAAVTLVVSYSHNLVHSYYSDRIWLACGLGASCVVRDTPGLPVREDGTQPFVTYNTGAELVAAVKSLLADPTRRKELGSQARSWTMERHTYENRIDELVSIIEKRKESCKVPEAHAEPATAPAA